MDIRKLQRAIVDGLEDVKAQDILVFNTEHLSPLFERVIIASGTSNRQTKALASSVRVSVKSGGMEVMRTEGEDNGEWIIVDCGAAVAHIMQPAIRDYYRLEEIWGGKPVKMKLGDAKTSLVKASEDDSAPAKKPAAKKAAPRQAATAASGAGQAALSGAKKARTKAAPEAVPVAKKPTAARKVTAGGTTVAKAAAKPPAKPARAAAQPVARPVAKKAAPARAPVKTTTGGKTTAAKTTTAKAGSAAPAKAAPKKIQTIVVKPVARKTPRKAAPARKTSR